jgi:hypothetical protein
VAPFKAELPPFASYVRFTAAPVQGQPTGHRIQPFEFDCMDVQKAGEMALKVRGVSATCRAISSKISITC